MFSSIQGFTSISDLNQQFVNLTNALTNLDTLQPDGENNNTNNNSSIQNDNDSSSNNNHDDNSDSNNEKNSSNVSDVHNEDDVIDVVNADHNIIVKSTAYNVINSNNSNNSNNNSYIRSDNGINKKESESKQKEINVILDDLTLTMKQLKDEQLKNHTLEQRNILLEHCHDELNNKYHDYKIIAEKQILELKTINDDKTNMMEILQHKYDILLSSSSSSSSSSSDVSDASDSLSNLHIIQLEQLTNDKNKFKHLYDEEYSRSTTLQLKVDQITAMIQKLEYEAIESSKQYQSQLQNERSQSLLSIQEIIENHKNNINNYEIKYKEYEDKLLIAHDEISSLKIESNQKVVNNKMIHDQIINELNSELIDLKKEILILTNNNQQINNDYQQITIKCNDYIKQISNYEELTSNNQNSIQQLSSNYNELNLKYHEKENYSIELEQKISTLTDKLKEVMQKYADFQSKSRNQAQHLEGRVSELTKLCQAKDSEITGFRLKLENTERTSSDLRLKANELAERYGESQRELTKLHDEINKIEEKLIMNNEQLQKSNEINQIINNDNIELTNKINNITENYNHEIKDLNEQIIKLNNKYSNYEKDNNNHIHELQNEVNSLNNRLKIESESAGNLDNYKKRAQLALQKANNTANTLSKENEQLKETCEDALLRFNEVKESLRSCRDDEAAVRERLRDVELSSQATISKLQAKHVEIEDILRKITSDFELQTTQYDALKLTMAKYKDRYNTGRDLALDNDRNNNNNNSSSSHNNSNNNNNYSSQQDHDDDSNGNKFEDSKSDGMKSDDSSSYEEVRKQHSSPQHSHHHQQQQQQQQHEYKSHRQDSWAIIASRSSHNNNNSGSNLDIYDDDNSINNSNNSNNNNNNKITTTMELDHNFMIINDDSIDNISASTSTTINHHDNNNNSTINSGKLTEYSLFIKQLQYQSNILKKELVQRGIDLEATRQELQYEKDENKNLHHRIDELISYIDRIKHLHDGSPDSNINMEYLKNCIYKYMISIELSEKKRLYPVIATILKLTNHEILMIENAFNQNEQRDNEFEQTISSISTFATSSFGKLWG